MTYFSGGVFDVISVLHTLDYKFSGVIDGQVGWFSVWHVRVFKVHWANQGPGFILQWWQVA